MVVAVPIFYSYIHMRTGHMVSSANSKRSKEIVRTIKVVIFLTILTAIVFWPVLKVIQFFQPNSRMYFKGCIEATAILDGSDAEYVHLEIGRAGYEYAGNPKLELKFPDGAILTFPEVDLPELNRLSYSNRESTEFTDIHPLAKEYLLPGCSVVIFEQKIVQVILYGFEDSGDVFIRTDMSKDWHAMPMSDDDLIELFGEPDRIKDDLRL